jgi:hypothetical protein
MTAPTLAVSPACDLDTCSNRPTPGSHLCEMHDPIVCVICAEPIPPRDVVELDGLPHCQPCTWAQVGDDRLDRTADR